MKKLLSVLACIMTGTFMTAQTTDSLQLQEVVVTGARHAIDVRHLPMTVTVIGREKLTEQHQASVLPTAMQQVPGLFVTSRAMTGYGVSTGAAGGINMRGISGGAGQLLVLIDGHPQYQGIYGHPISDSYQSLMADRVEVLRGPASVLYGSNAMGGVLNIVTRKMHGDGVKTTLDLGAGSYGTIQTEATNQVRSGKFTSTVSAQYNRTDNHRSRMGFEQYGGYMKLGYDLSPHWNTYVDADITHFNASYPGAVSSPLYDANQWITRGMVSAAVENHYSRTSGALSVYSNFGRHKIDDGTSDPAKPTQRYFRSKDALTGISWYQSFVVGDMLSPTHGRLTVGADYQHIYGHAYYTSKQTGEVLDTPNKQSGKSYRNEIAGYVDYRQDLLGWLTLDAGVRVDHHSITGTEWIPQAGVVVRPIATGEVKAMVSKGFRNPTMKDMFLYKPANEELEPERMMSYELSWKHRVMEGSLTYGINLFLIKADNIIQTVAMKNINTGKLLNKGIEAELSYRINNNWSVNTNHSYLHMNNPVVAAPQYKGYLGVNWNCCKWSATAGLQQICGLYTVVGENAEKESFTLLNATVGYQMLKCLGLWVKGENLLAQRYEVIKGYPMPRATFMAGVNITF